jgi:D-glutamate cyclase
MTPADKLAAILAAVQTDPGGRGLARDPHDNLFTATKGDFEAACRSIAEHPKPILNVVTGFIIPSVEPPTFETDGPLGAVFLSRAFATCGVSTLVSADLACSHSFVPGLNAAGVSDHQFVHNIPHDDALAGPWVKSGTIGLATHVIGLERVGPAANGRYHTMRGADITDLLLPAHHLFRRDDGRPLDWQTIGIGDGGNEIGMGKIPHDTIVKNIPNGDLIHCRVPTDHLIVAGVSNWGAYALAAGVFVLKGVTPPADLFDPDREREILEVMVREGPLVDGVTGQQTATVDGLTWDEYVKPLIRIRDILGA